MLSESAKQLSSVPQFSPLLGTDFGNVYGILYMGIIVASILYGITCVQTFVYFNSRRQDKWIIKLLVSVLLIFDTTHQAFLTYTGYYFLILNFGNVAGITNAVWSDISAVFLFSLTAFFVQWFFAYRLYKMTSGRKRLFVLLVVVFMLAQLAINFAWTIEALLALEGGPGGYTISTERRLTKTAVPGYACAVVADVLITIGLCYFLHRSRTGFQRSESLINRLIAYTVSTGFITSIDALLFLIMYVTLSDKLYYTFFQFLAPRLYCNSLLAALNIRSVLRDDLSEDSIQSFPISVLRRIGATKSTDEVVSNPIDIHVRVDKDSGSSQADISNEDHGEKGNGSNTTLSKAFQVTQPRRSTEVPA